MPTNLQGNDAPISTNMTLGYLSEHVLGLPRSY